MCTKTTGSVLEKGRSRERDVSQKESFLFPSKKKIGLLSCSHEKITVAYDLSSGGVSKWQSIK